MRGKNPHTVYRFFSDPAHGWLEVPLSEIEELEISDKISTYSYQSTLRGFAYLEEDCDLSVYLDALGYSRGTERSFFDNHVSMEYLNSDACGNVPHYIRNCERFNAR